VNCPTPDIANPEEATLMSDGGILSPITTSVLSPCSSTLAFCGAVGSSPAIHPIYHYPDYRPISDPPGGRNLTI